MTHYDDAIAAVNALNKDLVDTEAALTVCRETVSSQSTEIKQLKADLAECQKPDVRFPGDPGVGNPYYGLNRDGGDPSAREAQFGAKVECYRSYMGPTQAQAGIDRAKRDLDAGRLPIISWKVPNNSWPDVASGKQDAWVKQIMDGLGALAKPVWMCLHHEPTDDATGGKGTNSGTAADYKAMYRHVYPMKPANVALVPILQSGPFDNVGGQDYQGLKLTDWIDPAAADIIGYDIYNHWHIPPGTFYKWRPVPSILAFADVVAKAFPGKTQAVCEYGTRTKPDTPGLAATWMRDLQAGYQARGDVVAMSFFDSGQNVNDGGTPWSLDDKKDGTDGTERLNAFKEILTG